MYVHRIYAKCKRAHQQHIAIAHMPMSRRTYAPYKVYVFAIIVLYYCTATATAKKLHKKVSLTLLRSERKRERKKYGKNEEICTRKRSKRIVHWYLACCFRQQLNVFTMSCFRAFSRHPSAFFFNSLAIFLLILATMFVHFSVVVVVVVVRFFDDF